MGNCLSSRPAQPNSPVGQFSASRRRDDNIGFVAVTTPRYENKDSKALNHTGVTSASSLSNGSNRPASLVSPEDEEATFEEEDPALKSEALKAFVSDPAMQKARLPMEDLVMLRMLSQGAFGEVWLAQWRAQHVAIKKLLPQKSTSTPCIEQFAAEIELMKILQHPHIVSFIGVSWDSLANLCGVVEYMEAGDLHSVLAKKGARMTWAKQKLEISMDIVDALAYLHTRHPPVVHRDIKSKNVLINRKGEAKLSDFGVSRTTSDTSTMTTGVGTLLWTAPEILTGNRYSEKADIFSLGVLLSEIDTCREPYADQKNADGGRKTPMRVAHEVGTGKMHIQLRPDCPALLRDLADRCVKIQAEDRPSATEVLRMLREDIAPMLQSTDGEAIAA